MEEQGNGRIPLPDEKDGFRKTENSWERVVSRPAMPSGKVFGRKDVYSLMPSMPTLFQEVPSVRGHVLARHSVSGVSLQPGQRGRWA